jgi:hypothetical protein
MRATAWERHGDRIMPVRFALDARPASAADRQTRRQFVDHLKTQRVHIHTPDPRLTGN